MTKSLNTVLGLALIAALSAQPALAQKKDKNQPAAPVGPVIIQGIAVANLNQAVQASNAWRVAQQQIPEYYKASFDAAAQRRQATENQLKPLVDKFNADQAKPGANQQLLQQQYEAIQKINQQGEEAAQKALAPAILADAFVKEQLGDKLEAAVDAAMKRRNVTLLLQPGSVLRKNGDGYDLTSDVVTELNTLVPSANIVPPAGWLPREVREQQARQQAAQAAQGQPAATPATPAPRPAQPAGPQPDGR